MASIASSPDDLDTSRIKEWRSIVTLIVFVATNLIVLWPFSIPVYVPKLLRDIILKVLSSARIISPRVDNEQSRKTVYVLGMPLVRFNFPLNLVTAPLAADLFLLAILAIGREEVAGGTIGADNIVPIDIMAFFITLAYIAVSLDATGLIRYLAYKVLTWGGKSGRRLFFYLYLFWFALTACIGNDPIILSGTPFLAYMTRVAKNIDSPRAWIFTQFTMANVASAILVSSNPTNLVLAGAFQIKFIEYTANVIVPVIFTALFLFPFLLFVIFRKDGLVPRSIDMHELSDEARARKPLNPNIPGVSSNDVNGAGEDKLLSLEEVMNPYVDKWSAAVIAGIMATALIVVLVLNAATSGSAAGGHAYPVFWVTLPAAVVAFTWDVVTGWLHRHENREIARQAARGATLAVASTSSDEEKKAPVPDAAGDGTAPAAEVTGNQSLHSSFDEDDNTGGPTTVTSLARGLWKWARVTFPNASHVLALLPWPLIPFAFCMFVLVQALVTKGWIPVFAYGWDAWVNLTGTVGAIGGMGFLSVLLCNFAGTNIGTTILLSRVIQAWQAIHDQNGIPISSRTFWATVYSMAIGVNYGAFSLAFSGALAGLLWRDILHKKFIRIGNREFAWVNVPIIAFSMVIGCAVLVGEVYITRGTEPYNA